MGAFLTPKEKRARNKKIAVFVAWIIGAWLVTALLTSITPAAKALVAVGLGLSVARGFTRPTEEAPIASAKAVRCAEVAFLATALIALGSLPSSPTVAHGFAGALTVAAVVFGGRHLARRHQSSQPTGTWFGVVLDSWGRIPGRAPAAALLAGSIVLGGALNMYLWLGPLVGVVLAVVAGCRYWTKARKDAETRESVSEDLSGAGQLSGGEWTPLLLEMKRAPIWSLDLNDEGIPVRIVIPIPPTMPASAQAKAEDDIIDRLKDWGNYSVKWHTGGPGRKRHAVIQWWPPLPDLVLYDGRPGDKRKVWLGTGKVNREMLATRPDATVGAQEDVFLDLAEIPHALIVGGTGGGKSVVAVNLMIQWIKADNLLCILDPKQVGFNRFAGKRNVLKVATNIFEIRDTIVAGRNEMDARYARMKETGLDNIMDLPEGERPKPLLFLIDEATEAMTVEKVSKDDEEGNERNQAAMEIRAAVSAIVRLGRAAGVHLIALTQRADVSDGLAGSTKNNLEFRVLLGAADNTARLMAGFADSMVAATPGKRGRGICGRVNTAPIETQFAYAPNADIERFLADLDLAPEAVVYGDEGVSVLDAVAATQSESERLEVLRTAIAAGDLTDDDAKALGFEDVAEVQELLDVYDARKAESEKDAADEIVLSQIRKAGGASRDTKRDTGAGDTTEGSPGTPVNNSGDRRSDLSETRKHTGKRVDPLPEGEAEAVLEHLIGLGETKAQIAALKAQVVMALKRAEIGVGDGNVAPGHLIFQGPPGTGKTTVARIVGSILRDLGVLSSGHVIEMTPKDVKAPYLGQSGPMADSACDDALDGVLFVDEAYGLARDEFSREALEQIMVRAENDRTRLCVILAGYPKEMDDLLDVNPGMRSRFSERIHFPNYDRADLVAIAEAMIADAERVIAPDAKGALVDLMAAQDLSARDWGNARSVRNLVGAAMAANDARLTALLAQGVDLTPAQMLTLTREDILAAGDGDWGNASSGEPLPGGGGDDPSGGLYGIPGIEPPAAPVDPAPPTGGLDAWMSGFPDDEAV